MPIDHGRLHSHPHRRSSRSRTLRARIDGFPPFAHALRVLTLASLIATTAFAPTRAQEAAQDASTSVANPAPTAATPVEAAPRAPRSAESAPRGVQTPRSLFDLSAWLDYKSRNHLAALPQEARLFYRRGLMVAQSGSPEEALRLVRGAAELDPSYVAPHLTLASWSLLREPSQALVQYGTILELARDNFRLQLALAGNAIFLAMQALFLALLAAGMILIGLHHRELRHGWVERMSTFISPGTARWWSWAFVVLPYFAGLGPALPTLVFLGLLWPALRLRERGLFVALLAVVAGAPWAAGQLERLTLPLREDRPPMFGIALVENEAWSAKRAATLAAVAEAHPDNPFVQFASGWMARRGADLPAAEAAYRRALTLWPADDRVENNLGNTVAMQGRPDEALRLYLSAVERNPANAAAWFNASQIYTQRFEYHAATDAISRASALNFELVKTYQAQATDDGVLPLVDQWLAPRTQWHALGGGVGAAGDGALPPAWRSRIECSGPTFSVVALALALLGVVVGWRQQRAMPLRKCSNCGAVICRRCARRRRETALCDGCAIVESRAENPDFGRVLLLQHRRKLRSTAHAMRTALATLIPGFGLLGFRRVVAPVLLLAVTAMLLSDTLRLGVPYAYEPRVALAEMALPVLVRVGLWVAVYAISIGAYLFLSGQAEKREAERAAPIRSRTTAPTRRSTAAAA